MRRNAIEYRRPVDGRSAETSASAETTESAETTASTETAETAGDLTIVATITDEGGPGREALGGALERLAAGEAEVLLTPTLRSVAGSLPEVLALIDWLVAADADLVALDVGLDTGSETGQDHVALLREIEGWNRAPESGRSPRGRPGLVGHRPELAERIVALREQGLSLQRIADLLNAEAVPTPRGGAVWRPSSVQAALGYRRPRPPVPGAPPPGRGPRPPADPGPRPPADPGPKPHADRGSNPHADRGPNPAPTHTPKPHADHGPKPPPRDGPKPRPGPKP
jgi:hypothetical protein